MGKRGKKYSESLKKVDRSKRYELEVGVKLLTETATAKFDEGVDVAVRLGVDPKKPDQMVRGPPSFRMGEGRRSGSWPLPKALRRRKPVMQGLTLWGPRT